jgi:hypothetical protein
MIIGFDIMLEIVKICGEALWSLHASLLCFFEVENYSFNQLKDLGFGIMCILISARTELKQNLDWNRIKFPSPKVAIGIKGGKSLSRISGGIFQIKSVTNLATCSFADIHIWDF